MANVNPPTHSVCLVERAEEGLALSPVLLKTSINRGHSLTPIQGDLLGYHLLLSALDCKDFALALYRHLWSPPLEGQSFPQLAVPCAHTSREAGWP